MHDEVKSDNRKQEFLHVALQLFYEKGYENTTINDIIEHMDVSKGAFYHYFESKEDVIVTLAKVYTDRAVRIIKKIIARPDLSVIGKLNEVFCSMNEYKYRERDLRFKFRGAIKSEANLKLQHKIINYVKQDAIGLFEELIDRGAAEGVIGDPVNPRELADFFLNTMFSLNIEVNEMENELYNNENKLDYQGLLGRLDEKVRFYEMILERIFQQKEGAFDLRTAYVKRFQHME